MEYKINYKISISKLKSIYKLKGDKKKFDYEEPNNLRNITMLRKKFSCNVGYSGHEVSAYRVSLIAVSLGATSIERHITLDRTMYGSDQAASLEPTGLKRMVRDIRDVEAILGNGKKQIWDSEISVKKKLRG